MADVDALQRTSAKAANRSSRLDNDFEPGRSTVPLMSEMGFRTSCSASEGADTAAVTGVRWDATATREPRLFACVSFVTAFCTA